MGKRYGNKEVLGDSACPSCIEQGKDTNRNHLIHWKNVESDEEWTSCNRCGHYEVITSANRDSIEQDRQVRRVLTDEEVKGILKECSELPIKALDTRGITKAVAERFEVRVGLSSTDGSTVVSHFYPKTVDGVLTGYKVRSLDPKYFYGAGRGSGCDLFGINQAQRGDVWTGKLFIFEDELSAMSGFQIMIEHAKTSYRPSVVALPDGSGSAAAALQRNQSFIESYKEITVCMDNDEAGDSAVRVIRSLYPHVKVAHVPKGDFDGKPIQDANDMHMADRGLEMYNKLRFSASQDTPDSAVSIAECMEEALKKPEWGIPYPWEELTRMTYGLTLGELIAVGGGVSCGKTLLAHEMAAWFSLEQGINCGMFMLEEGVGTTVRNVAGKAANTPFHLPDLDYSPEDLKQAAMQFEGKLWLYNNFGQNSWEKIKQCIRFWVIQNECRIIFLDNITALVSHLTPSEINSEVSKISSELAGMCQELHFTCFVFSHLNPASSGPPHEEGGAVREVQFTGSRALMRWSQVILGFERNKQADGEGKNLSLIRLLKDRKFGKSGMVYTKYINDTGRLLQRKDSEVSPDNPFEVYDSDYGESSLESTDGDYQKIY